MKKSLWIWIPLAAVLLTGCSGNDGADSIAEGMTAMENKEYQTALEDFKAAAALGENDAAAYRGEGLALMGLGQYAEAAQAFDTALEATDEKMPNTKRDILYYKATALYKNKDYENTISVCDEILTLNQEGDACYLRGACYMAQGDYDKAKTDFDAAVALSPKDYDLVLDIYGCYQEQKRSADGAPYLENALNIEDSSDEGSYQKARIYFYLEDYDNAQSLLNPLVEKKNGEAMALMATWKKATPPTPEISGRSSSAAPGRARPPITASCSATSRTAIMLPPWEMWTKAWPYPGKKHGRNSCTTRSLPANVRAISTPPGQKPRNMWKNTPRTSAAPGNTPSCRRGKLMGMNTIEELKERVILIGVSTSDGDDTEESLKELKELADTAGAETVGTVIQNREAVHPGTYIGKGKIEEVRAMAFGLNATGVICDDELSPAQLNNLEQELDLKVMDRTLIILDIFAAHARTSEGKIQVELAQLKYRQARLVGLRNSLSRLGGGIGTRGPGEKKLEMDRRLIKSRIAQLNRELAEVKRHREITRAQRSRSHMPVAAIVGYTNAGKSTLLNRLTGAGVLEENKLFATLDPTTRTLTLDNGTKILLTDTVGFIRKLPHHLVEAFKSTLEEAKYADVILHVVDASNEQMETQMYVVYDTLRRLEVGDKPILTLFNKTDREGIRTDLRDLKADQTLKISAKTGAGLSELTDALEEVLRRDKIYVERLYPFDQAGIIQLIRKEGELVSEEYTAEGIEVRAYVPRKIYEKV